MYIYDENEDDDNNGDDNNHNLIKQKKKTFLSRVDGTLARWSQKARYTGATTWNLPSGFSTLLVPVFIKTFINSICKILIKLIDLQMPSRPVVEKASPHQQQQQHARHHQPPDQNPSIHLTPKRRTRLRSRSRSRRSRSRNPTTTRRQRPRSSTSCRSRIALACKGSAEEDDSFRSSRSSRRSCRSNQSIIPPHSHSCRIYSCM